MSNYTQDIDAAAALCKTNGSAWNAINPESVARMRAQNHFKTGLDIAKYTADIMRKDMAAYDADTSKYTQSLGCWHGFMEILTVVTCTFLVGWLLHCVLNLVLCLINPCMKKLLLLA